MQAAIKRAGLSTMAAIVAALSVFAAAQPVTAASAYVQDNAGMFSPETLAAIQSRIDSLTAATGKSIAVITVPGLQGKAVEEAATARARELGLNGAIIFISNNDHQLSIAYGAGTRVAFPPALQQQIKGRLREAIHRSDFNGGIAAAVNSIAGTMESARSGVTQAAGAPAGRHAPQAATAPQSAGPLGIAWIWWIVGLGLLFLIMRRRPAAPMGMSGPGVPGQYPSGQYPQQGGGMGSFVPGLLGGAAGAYLGSTLANRGGEVPPASAAPDQNVDFGTNDAGGGFADSGGSGDFGGGGGGDAGGGSGW